MLVIISYNFPPEGGSPHGPPSGVLAVLHLGRDKGSAVCSMFAVAREPSASDPCAVGYGVCQMAGVVHVAHGRRRMDVAVLSAQPLPMLMQCCVGFQFLTRVSRVLGKLR